MKTILLNIFVSFAIHASPVFTPDISLPHTQYAPVQLVIMVGLNEAQSTGSYGIFIHDPTSAENLIPGVIMPRDGELVNAWVTTEPGQSDHSLILVWTKSAGSGAHGKIDAFSFDRHSIHPASIPKPHPLLLDGHRGYDTYSFSNNILLHSFPLFHPLDANDHPTAGTQTLMLPIGASSWMISPPISETIQPQSPNALDPAPDQMSETASPLPTTAIFSCTGRARCFTEPLFLSPSVVTIPPLPLPLAS